MFSKLKLIIEQIRLQKFSGILIINFNTGGIVGFKKYRLEK